MSRTSAAPAATGSRSIPTTVRLVARLTDRHLCPIRSLIVSPLLGGAGAKGAPPHDDNYCVIENAVAAPQAFRLPSRWGTTFHLPYSELVMMDVPATGRRADTR